MRAVVCDEFGSFDKMSVKDVPEPILKPNEVLINVKAAGVSFAQSLKVAGKYQVKPPLPFIPGSEVSGIVSALYDGVENIAVGDHIFATVANGGFAEKVVARSVDCKPIPEGMSFGPAVLFAISYPTSYAALIWKAHLVPGETILVHGAAGAIGMAAVEIAKANGARVIATAGSDKKCAIAKNHGADLTINYLTTDFKKAVKDWTGGKGVDIVIDPVGGNLLLDSIRAMNRESRLVTLGYASGSIPTPPVNLLLVKNMSIIGLNFGTYVNFYKEKCFPVQQVMRDLYKKGKLDPHLMPLFTDFRREYLFDTEVDPNELKNLVDSTHPQHLKALTEMRAALDTWVTATGDMGWQKEPPEKIEKFRAVMYDWFGAPEWYPYKPKKSSSALEKINQGRIIED